MEVPPLPELYDRINSAPNCKSHTKKYLTREVVDKYKDVKTPLGGTLAMCVYTNACNPSDSVPRCADSHCYTVFKDFFEPVIRGYHKLTTPTIQHPKLDFGDLTKLPFGDLDPSGDFVVSTRVRVGRTVKGYPFAPVITRENRIELEKNIADALKKLDGDHAGSYYPLDGMEKDVQEQLVKDHFLFRNDESVLRDAGGYRDWPTGRGIFFNDKKTFLVWINEEDHIRIISMQSGGNLAEVYRRLIAGIHKLEQHLEFERHDRFGFLTFCPSNLGTTMRASVHLRIPFLSEMPNFDDICEKYNLAVRGTHGEHTESVGGVHDISNKRRLGITELQAACAMADGCKEMIRLEGLLRSNNTLESLEKGLMPVEPLSMLADMLLNNKECNSYTKRHLTPEIVAKYENEATKRGSTLAHCIRTGAYHGKAMLPRMGDPECYDTFKEYVDAIIKDYHQITAGEVVHPPADFGDLESLPFGDIDPSGSFVVSTRVRISRTVEGYSFPPSITKAQRLTLEKTISEALKGLTGIHAGKYYQLEGMDPATQSKLDDDKLLFKDDDPVLRDAGGYRHWPTGRGIFHNDAKSFLVWVCEEDHMRMASMQKGGNLGEVYRRLASGIKEIEAKMEFTRHPKYGYLTFCPSNIGTTMRISVRIRIPKLSSDNQRFQEVCKKYSLEAREFPGEDTGIFDLSNKSRLGNTEVEAAAEMAKSVEEIIKIEQSL